MSFASLGTFSNNVESALIPCYDLNIDKYIQKSKEIFDWVEIMEYPPHIFTCQNGCYFIVGKKLILYKENKFYVEAR